jgi:hypothetical protein
MALRISDTEKNKLFNQVKVALGAPLRTVELTEEQLLVLLGIAVEDYVEQIQNYIIEAQWPSLYGVNVNEADLTKSLITRNFDIVTQYTYSYSKIIGLGAGEGGYELKKDYFELQAGVQIYQIPANREINEIMWYNPATLDQSVIDPYMGMFTNTFGSSSGGLNSYYMMPAFDIMLRTADRNLKNKLLNSNNMYKITNGPNGTKFVHLSNTPGGTYDRSNRLLSKGKVWYWYYDINGNREACLEANKDIIKAPSDVPLDDVSFDELNSPSKTWVRRYFQAKAMETLSKVRGKFSGKVAIENNDVELDYQSLATEASDIISTLREELKDRLDRMSPLNMLKRVAEEAEALNNSLKYRPMKYPIVTF